MWLVNLLNGNLKGNNFSTSFWCFVCPGAAPQDNPTPLNHPPMPPMAKQNTRMKCWNYYPLNYGTIKSTNQSCSMTNTWDRTNSGYEFPVYMAGYLPLNSCDWLTLLKRNLNKNNFSTSFWCFVWPRGRGGRGWSF